MKSKKGIELTMNTIIIAVIVLIVLVVLILLLTGQTGKTRIGLNKTQVAYTENCEIPGTGRVCRFPYKCDDIGGISYGEEFADCKRIPGQICCSD